MKEIGGYFEYETYYGNMLHDDGILLNCGRNCIAYLIKIRQIKKIAMPYFICDSVIEVCKKYDVKIHYYHIKDDLRPEDIDIDEDEWFYLMNYYGQLTYEEIKTLSKKYVRVIVDFSQDYFHGPADGVDSIYTCRKFFGVSDGAVLYTDAGKLDNLEMDESYSRMGYLMGRYERTATEFYPEAAANNKFFDNEPIKSMSKLTRNILKSVDYDLIKQKRTQNYRLLHDNLEKMNKLSVRLVEGAFAYPFLIENGDIVRKNLVNHKIYIATLWPNVIGLQNEYLEQYFAKNILPLPCDHRYTEEDMKRIACLVKELL